MTTDAAHVQTAPLAAYPEPVREAVAEFLTARQRWQESSSRAGALAADESLRAARASDGRAALEAARAGEDPGQVGTPAEDELRARQAEAERSAEAYGSLMREAWARAADKIGPVAAEQADRWRAERDARAEATREALEALRTAERKWANATSAVAYFVRAAEDPTTPYGGYGTGAGEIPTAVHVNLAPLAEGLDRVAQAQDRGLYRQTEVPAQEAAAPGETRAPRKRAPKRIRGGE